MAQLLRLQNFTCPATATVPGRARPWSARSGTPNPAELVAWAGATASWPNRTDPGETEGLDDYFTRDFRTTSAPRSWAATSSVRSAGPWEDDDWKGWWGDDPPFRTPVFVLTHHVRPSFTLGDTTFHFLDATPADALRRRRRPPTARTCASAAAWRRSASSSTPTSSTRCTSPWRRSNSVAANGCGRRPTNCSTASTSRRCRARAA